MVEERRERIQKKMITQANRQRLLDLRNNKTESGVRIDTSIRIIIVTQNEA